ncbi:hypothetical protein AK830_g2336 [Neonectria ditissima]|uniref:Uncharacterized protein n=1 Tax=Neonectria ditissima TaxID=78410 RepID=A0A0P7BUF1_9HYPO|nr:hypothetical protein AK830_g2336 [Neonectria ditissima]
MEWAAAVGVASGILSFVTFTHEAFKVIRQVLDHGSTADNEHCELLAGDMNEVLSRIRERAPLEGSDHANALEDIAKQTEKDGLELVQILTRLQPPPKDDDTTPSQGKLKRTTDAIKNSAEKAKRAALTLAKRREVDDLERRIDKSRNQLVMRMQVLLNERQFAVKLELDSLRTELCSQNNGITAQLRSLNRAVKKSSAILIAMEDAAKKPSPAIPDNQWSPDTRGYEALINQVGSLETALNALLQRKTGLSPEMRVLKRLFFSRIYDRKQQVATAEAGTYTWILDEHEDPACASDPLRAQARSRLLKWLRSENNIIHLSGKPGSGKSTLMKLLLEHPRTRQELRHWANGKTLVFSYFFFWRAGNEIQNSLMGLYRSILFETLLQCPELIPRVFSDAYDKFSTTRAEDCIEELYFQPENIENAFDALVSEKLPAGYRFCFLVDGLDEFGQDGRDRLDHELLAKKLTLWATNHDVKILASSRPHTEFNEEFSKTHRIKLHEITASDIYTFCRNMFLNHKNFHLVKDFYLDLVRKVAENAEGVFLWARVVIHTLHATISSRRVTLRTMLQHLDALPKELSDLYEQLLASLPPLDRIAASKMLLVIARNREPLSALAVSWIDEWENPEFPASWNMTPYSRREIELRREDTEAQLDGLTKGLVELNVEFGLLPYYGHTVKLYHRTIRDYILLNNYIQKVATNHPCFVNGEVHLRIGLALLWFIEPRHRRAYVSRARIHLPKEWSVPNSLLPAFEKAMDCETDGLPVFQRRYLCLSPWRERNDREEHSAMSFDHWAIWVSEQPLQILNKIRTQSKSSQTKATGLSFLLAAALGGKATTVKTLLQWEFSPHLCVPLYRDYSSDEIVSSGTVWMIFSISLANAVLNGTARQADFMVLELLLGATGPKTETFFLLSAIPAHIDLTNRQCTNQALEPKQVLPLRQLITHANPTNLNSILDLMDQKEDGYSGWISYLHEAGQSLVPWRFFSSLGSGKAFKMEDYHLFRFDENESDRSKYLVHSMHWGDKMLHAFMLDAELGYEISIRLF